MMGLDMRKLPQDFDPTSVDLIFERLNQVRADGKSVVFAIESGSRAWGFSSPDSDYDCRFVYVSAFDDHFALQPPRDVVEFPIEGLIDTGGWDLRKALKLALNGNAAIVEWVQSPIVYEEVTGFRERFMDVLSVIVDPHAASRHYLGLARNTYLGQNKLNGLVKIKKLLYILRPLLALKWIISRDFKSLPPMNIEQLLNEISLSCSIHDAIVELIEIKKTLGEKECGSVNSIIVEFVRSELRFFEYEKPLLLAGERTGEKDDHYFLAQEFYMNECERFCGFVRTS